MPASGKDVKKKKRPAPQPPVRVSSFRTGTQPTRQDDSKTGGLLTFF